MKDFLFAMMVPSFWTLSRRSSSSSKMKTVTKWPTSGWLFHSPMSIISRQNASVAPDKTIVAVRSASMVNHTFFNFLDKKHFINHNGQKLRARVDPLSGSLPCIPVDGDFREAHNLMPCVLVNHRKSEHIIYTLTKEKGTSSYFEEFVRLMVESGFLTHGEVLIMDNATIHSQGNAQGCANYLWNTKVDSKPLNMLVIYLPTKALELNLIKLIFHILVLRLKSYHYHTIALIE